MAGTSCVWASKNGDTSQGEQEAYFASDEEVQTLPSARTQEAKLQPKTTTFCHSQQDQGLQSNIP